MKIIMIVGILVGLIIISLLIMGWRRTYVMEHGQNQASFKTGTANISEFNGEYRGIVSFTTSWQGKTVLGETQSGLNRFQENNSIVSKYPFAIYVGKGLRDKQLDVIKLDYNQPGNPWWLKFIVDEVVEIAPQTYLGKVHVHLLPGVTFTLGYFTLEKNE